MKLVVELQLADDRLDPVERCLILQDRDHTLAIDSTLGTGGWRGVRRPERRRLSWGGPPPYRRRSHPNQADWCR